MVFKSTLGHISPISNSIVTSMGCSRMMYFKVHMDEVPAASLTYICIRARPCRTRPPTNTLPRFKYQYHRSVTHWCSFAGTISIESCCINREGKFGFCIRIYLERVHGICSGARDILVCIMCPAIQKNLEPNLQIHRLFNLLIINIKSDVVLAIIHTHGICLVPQILNLLEVLIIELDELGIQGSAFGSVALGDDAGASLECPR